jgi:hypothetical protein
MNTNSQLTLPSITAFTGAEVKNSGMKLREQKTLSI